MQAAQLMAMMNSILGQYQDAEDLYYTAFPAGRNLGKCPVSDMII